MTRDGARFDRDPEVRGIAKALGVAGSDLRARLCAAAVEKVTRHMERYQIEPETLEDVQSVVLNMTGVRIERVDSDARGEAEVVSPLGAFTMGS